MTTAAKHTHVVLIGAGYAGRVAAARLAGKTRQQDVAITLVNATDSYVERVRLHEWAANQPVQQRTISSLVQGTRIKFLQGFVSAIEPARHEVIVQTGPDTTRISYDELIYALGSTIDRASVTGVREHAYTLTPAGPLSASAMRESISMAFLVLLETLTPIERAVFLLREVFDYEYAEIAEIVDKEESACRQLFSRAKKHIAEHRPRFKPAPERHGEFLAQFIQVVGTGELGGLMQLLDEDVTMWADGGGKARGAATRPLHGREAVARFLLSSTRLLAEDYRIELAEVNGDPSAIVRMGTSAVLVLAIELNEDRIQEIRVVGNPDKLQRL